MKITSVCPEASGVRACSPPLFLPDRGGEGGFSVNPCLSVPPARDPWLKPFCSPAIFVTNACVELKEQPSAPTLARKLGDVPHVSGLLRRLAQSSGAGERVFDWLLKVAVGRGANHYRRDFDPALPADLPAIHDEEIGVALSLGQHPYSLDALRVAAQFLSSTRVNTEHLCRLAVQERCEPVLLHIAEVVKKYAPEQEPWAFLRKHLLPRRVPRTDALPHWSRLVSDTGITREGPPRTDWLCRDE